METSAMCGTDGAAVWQGGSEAEKPATAMPGGPGSREEAFDATG
jgi:hypothetical protein